MPVAIRRGVKEGIGFGIIAGIIFAIAEIVAAGAMGNPPLAPFRMFASIVLGQAALEAVSTGSAILVGGIVHLILSGLFGLVYGLVGANEPRRTQTSFSQQVIIGLLFGAAVWLVNFQVIARLFYPWFLETGQGLQLVLHAVFYGLPLGLMYAGAERRYVHAGRAPA